MRLLITTVALVGLAGPLAGQQRLVTRSFGTSCDPETGVVSAYVPFASRGMLLRFQLLPQKRPPYDLTRFAFLVIGFSDKRFGSLPLPFLLPQTLTGGFAHCSLLVAPAQGVAMSPVPAPNYMWLADFRLPRAQLHFFAQAFQFRMLGTPRSVAWVRTSNGLRLDWFPR